MQKIKFDWVLVVDDNAVVDPANIDSTYFELTAEGVPWSIRCFFQPGVEAEQIPPNWQAYIFRVIDSEENSGLEFYDSFNTDSYPQIEFLAKRKLYALITGQELI